MMIREWWSNCDECGDCNYADLGFGVAPKTHREALSKFLKRNPDWKLSKGKLLCPDCISRNTKETK